MTISAQRSWDAYNDLLLHGDVDRFTKLLARYELYRMVIELPGDIVEGGVFKGAGLLYWAKLIEIFNPRTSRRVIGFDTFQGYPDSGREYERDNARAFERSTDYQPKGAESLAQIAQSQGLQQRIELVPGGVGSSVREYVQANPGFRIALLNLDFDTYDSTKAMLEACYELVVPRGVVVLDEYAARQWGESDAVDEFLKQKGIALRAFPWTHSPSAYFIKP